MRRYLTIIVAVLALTLLFLPVLPDGHEFQTASQRDAKDEMCIRTNACGLTDSVSPFGYIMKSVGNLIAALIS